MTTLPKNIVAGDLKRPTFEEVQGIDYDARQFELWHTSGFGWCIPTLLIGRARGRQTSDRTYATTLAGQTVRIGKGPHVTDTVVVYVRKATLARLQPFLMLRSDGAGKAGAVRDRISSRRVQGQEERAAGHHSWRWNR